MLLAKPRTGPSEAVRFSRDAVLARLNWSMAQLDTATASCGFPPVRRWLRADPNSGGCLANFSYDGDAIAEWEQRMASLGFTAQVTNFLAAIGRRARRGRWPSQDSPAIQFSFRRRHRVLTL